MGAAGRPQALRRAPGMPVARRRSPGGTGAPADLERAGDVRRGRGQSPAGAAQDQRSLEGDGAGQGRRQAGLRARDRRSPRAPGSGDRDQALGGPRASSAPRRAPGATRRTAANRKNARPAVRKTSPIDATFWTIGQRDRDDVARRPEVQEEVRVEAGREDVVERRGHVGRRQAGGDPGLGSQTGM